MVASKSHLNEDTQTFIDGIAGDLELVQAGSSLKFLKIAEGLADIYPRLGPTCEWDTAAAHAVVLGVGGTVTDLQGMELIYGKTRFSTHTLLYERPKARFIYLSMRPEPTRAHARSRAQASPRTRLTRSRPSSTLPVTIQLIRKVVVVAMTRHDKVFITLFLTESACSCYLAK